VSDPANNSVLEGLVMLFGKKTVFLPCGFGTKQPTGMDWQKVTFQRTLEPDYQAGARAVRQGRREHRNPTRAAPTSLQPFPGQAAVGHAR
jgi:hypothetical protein